MARAAAGLRRGLRVEALLVACLARAGVRLTTIPRLVRLLARLPRARHADGPGACADAARRAVRDAAHPTCLYTSLVAFGLLARRGHDVTFHLGVARAPGFEAHAWLSPRLVALDEALDEALAERPEAFAPIWDYRAARRVA
jgi:hypothetical protein